MLCLDILSLGFRIWGFWGMLKDSVHALSLGFLWAGFMVSLHGVREFMPPGFCVIFAEPRSLFVDFMLRVSGFGCLSNKILNPKCC